MRFFTIAGFALYWLDIRLFDHRTPSASLSSILQQAQDAENVLLFQYGDMAAQCYRIVNCDRHIDGWSRAQYTKYVAYPHSSA